MTRVVTLANARAVCRYAADTYDRIDDRGARTPNRDSPRRRPAAAGRLHLPQGLQVHLHQGSLDLPRQSNGTPLAALHPQRQHRDWQPLQPGDQLFWQLDGAAQRYQSEALALSPEARWPVFINEAAYGEKGIALSLCCRERWSCDPSWAEALGRLVQMAGPL